MRAGGQARQTYQDLTLVRRLLILFITYSITPRYTRYTRSSFYSPSQYVFLFLSSSSVSIIFPKDSLPDQFPVNTLIAKSWLTQRYQQMLRKFRVSSGAHPGKSWTHCVRTEPL